MVPPSSTLLLTAVAHPGDEQETGMYDNRAAITYDRKVEGVDEKETLWSLNREDLKPNTSIFVTQETKQPDVELTKDGDAGYSEGSLIDVVYTIDNPNAEITDVFMDIIFNPDFKIDDIASVTITDGSGVNIAGVETRTADEGLLSLSGSADGTTGFTLPSGKTVISFQLKAPPVELLADPDDSSIIMPLEIDYIVTSEMDDTCLLMAMKGLDGSTIIPYKVGKPTHIITNKNVTVTIKKQ
jgi:hypothetical protein